MTTDPVHRTTTTATAPAAGNADPVDEAERLTVEWAARVLEDPEACAEDNFLDLGGHSLLALRMCRYAKERFGVEYDLMVLFEADLATAARDLVSRAGNAATGTATDGEG